MARPVLWRPARGSLAVAAVAASQQHCYPGMFDICIWCFIKSTLVNLILLTIFLWIFGEWNIYKLMGWKNLRFSDRDTVHMLPMEIESTEPPRPPPRQSPRTSSTRRRPSRSATRSRSPRASSPSSRRTANRNVIAGRA